MLFCWQEKSVLKRTYMLLTRVVVYLEHAMSHELLRPCPQYSLRYRGIIYEGLYWMLCHIKLVLENRRMCLEHVLTEYYMQQYTFTMATALNTAKKDTTSYILLKDCRTLLHNIGTESYYWHTIANATSVQIATTRHCNIRRFQCGSRD